MEDLRDFINQNELIDLNLTRIEFTWDTMESYDHCKLKGYDLH